MSANTANKDAGATATSPTDRQPAASIERAWETHDPIVGHRLVTTRFGAKYILTGASGQEYWASPFVTAQIASGDRVPTASTPAVVSRYTSTKYGKPGYKLVSQAEVA